MFSYAPKCAICFSFEFNHINKLTGLKMSDMLDIFESMVVHTKTETYALK